MFAVDPLPFPPLLSEVRPIVAPSKAPVLAAAAAIEGTADAAAAERERTRLALPPNNKAGPSALLDAAEPYSRVIVVERHTRRHGGGGVAAASTLRTASVVFSQHFATAAVKNDKTKKEHVHEKEVEEEDCERPSRVSLLALDQHITVRYPFGKGTTAAAAAAANEGGEGEEGDAPPPAPPQPPHVMLPLASPYDAAPPAAAAGEEGGDASGGRSSHQGGATVPPAITTTQICAQLKEPEPTVTATQKKEDEKSPQQWEALSMPAATVAVLSGSLRDDSLWAITAGGMAYARVPIAESAEGMLSNDDDDESDVSTAGDAAEEKEDGDAAATAEERRQQRRAARRADAIRASQRAMAKHFSKRMDESTSDDEEEDSFNTQSSEIKTRSNDADAVDTAPFHCSWAFVPPSDVDHAAYRLRGREPPTNITPHHIMRHVTAASRECVWAITGGPDDGGRIVRREGFDRSRSVRGRHQQPPSYQHRVGDRWVDYSDDVVPMPAAIRARGGWFPAPVEGANSGGGGNTTTTVATNNYAAAEEEETPFATAWATHPRDCPFLAADGRQYGNALADALHRHIGGLQQQQQQQKESTPSNVNTAVSIAYDACNTTTTVAAALESPAPALPNRLAASPYGIAGRALKRREFVAASVGKDGSLWAVTEEEVITNVDPIAASSHSSSSTSAERRVWSRLWLREGSSLTDAGHRWVEASELFESIEALAIGKNADDGETKGEGTTTFAVPAAASQRYAKDAAAAAVPKMRILSLCHSVQHELFAVIAVGPTLPENEAGEGVGDNNDDGSNAYDNGVEWTRGPLSQYDPRRQGYLFQRIGITAANPTGTHWRRVVLEDALVLAPPTANISIPSNAQLLPIAIRSVAMCPVPDGRHRRANGLRAAYEGEGFAVYGRHESFTSAPASAVAVAADGSRVLDITAALRRHMATQEQSATYRITSCAEGEEEGESPIIPSPPNSYASAYGRLAIGDLLPLPLVLPERARLRLVPEEKSIAGANEGGADAEGDEAQPSTDRGGQFIASPQQTFSTITSVHKSTNGFVIATAAANRLGVGLNRYDGAARVLAPNVADIFIGEALLCFEKQKALNPLSVRPLRCDGGATVAASFGIEDDQSAAFSALSARGIAVPADLTTGLRAKLQLLRHRSSVPVPDTLRGSLLSMAVTRSQPSATAAAKKKAGSSSTAVAIVNDTEDSSAHNAGDEGGEDERDEWATADGVTDVVAAIRVSLNEEPETSSDEDEDDMDAVGGNEDDGAEGDVPFERRRTRAQFAVLTVWMRKMPPSPSPAPSAFAAAYARLHVPRYQVPAAPRSGLGSGDPLALFLHRLTGCDLNGAAEMARFERAASLSSTHGSERNALWHDASAINNKKHSSSSSSSLPITVTTGIAEGGPFPQRQEEAPSCPLIQTSWVGKANGSRRFRQRHIRVNVTIEVFGGSLNSALAVRLPFAAGDSSALPTGEEGDKDASALLLLLPPPFAADGDARELSYATQQCRTSVALHPSTVRILGLQPAAVDAKAKGPLRGEDGTTETMTKSDEGEEGKGEAAASQLTTITVTHRVAPLGHAAAAFGGADTTTAAVGCGPSSSKRTAPAASLWRHGYADPKIVIAVPLPPHTALRDLSPLFAVVDAEEGEEVSGPRLSDAHSSRYLRRLEALRGALAAAAAASQAADRSVACGYTTAYVAPTRATLFLSNGTNAVVADVATDGAVPSTFATAARTGANGVGAQLSAGAHVGFYAATAALPRAAVEAAAAVGAFAATAQGVFVMCPLTVEAILPNNKSLTSTREKQSVLLRPPQQHRGGAATSAGRPFLVAPVGRRTAGYQSIFVGHPSLDPLRADICVPAAKGHSSSSSPSEEVDTLWYPFTQKHTQPVSDAAQLSFVRVRDASLFICEGSAATTGGGIAAHMAATVELEVNTNEERLSLVASGSISLGGTNNNATSGDVAEDADKEEEADDDSNEFADGVPVTFIGTAEPSGFTARSAAANGSSGMPLATLSTVVVEARWLVTRAARRAPVALLGLSLRGGAASFMGLECRSSSLAVAQKNHSSSSAKQKRGAADVPSYPSVAFAFVAADGSNAPLGPAEVLKTRRLTVPIGAPLPRGCGANGGGPLGGTSYADAPPTMADVVAFISDWITNGKKETTASTSCEEEESPNTNSLRDAKAVALALLESIAPRDGTAANGKKNGGSGAMSISAWLHSYASTDAPRQAAEDKAARTALLRYLRAQPPKWLISNIREAGGPLAVLAEAGRGKKMAEGNSSNAAADAMLQYGTTVVLQAAGPITPPPNRKLLLCTSRRGPPTGEAQTAADVAALMASSSGPPPPLECGVVPVRWEEGSESYGRMPSLKYGGSIAWIVERCPTNIENGLAKDGNADGNEKQEGEDSAVVRDGDLVLVRCFRPPVPRPDPAEGIALPASEYEDPSDNFTDVPASASASDEPYLVPHGVRPGVTVWQIRRVRTAEEIANSNGAAAPAPPIDESPLQRAIRERAAIRANITFADAPQKQQQDVTPAAVSAEVVRRRGLPIRLSDAFELHHPTAVDAKASSAAGAIAADSTPQPILTFSIDNAAVLQASAVDPLDGSLAATVNTIAASSATHTAAAAPPAPVLAHYSRWQAVPVALAPLSSSSLERRDGDGRPSDRSRVEFAVRTIAGEGGDDEEASASLSPIRTAPLNTSNAHNAAAERAIPRGAVPLSVFGLDATAAVEAAVSTVTSDGDGEGKTHRSVLTVTVEGAFAHPLPLGKLGTLVNGSALLSNSPTSGESADGDVTSTAAAAKAYSNGPRFSMRVQCTTYSNSSSAEKEKEGSVWTSDFSFGPSTEVAWARGGSQRLGGSEKAASTSAISSANSPPSATSPLMANGSSSSGNGQHQLHVDTTRVTATTVAGHSANAALAEEAPLTVTVRTAIPIAANPQWPSAVGLPLAVGVTLCPSATSAAMHRKRSLGGGGGGGGNDSTIMPCAQLWAGSDVTVATIDGPLSGPPNVPSVSIGWAALADPRLTQMQQATAADGAEQTAAIESHQTNPNADEAQSAEKAIVAIAEAASAEDHRRHGAAERKAQLQQQLKQCDRRVRALIEQRAKAPGAAGRAQQAVLGAQLDELTRGIIPKLLVELAACEAALGEGKHDHQQQLTAAIAAPPSATSSFAAVPLNVKGGGTAVAGIVRAVGLIHGSGADLADKSDYLSSHTPQRLVINAATTNSAAVGAAHSLVVSTRGGGVGDATVVARSHPSMLLDVLGL